MFNPPNPCSSEKYIASLPGGISTPRLSIRHWRLVWLHGGGHQLSSWGVLYINLLGSKLLLNLVIKIDLSHLSHFEPDESRDLTRFSSKDKQHKQPNVVWPFKILTPEILFGNAWSGNLLGLSSPVFARASQSRRLRTELFEAAGGAGGLMIDALGCE